MIMLAFGEQRASIRVPCYVELPFAFYVAVIWAAFFIRVLLWYFLRSSTVLFGVNNTPLGFTLMEFSRSKRDALVSAFLNALYTAKGYTGGVPTETAQDQFRSPTRCMGCIPDGQDSLELWPRHFRIKSTVGFLGYSFKVRAHSYRASAQLIIQGGH